MGTSVMNKPLLLNSSQIEYGSVMSERTVVTVPLNEDSDTAAWSQLAVTVFARDWDSEEDAVYDQVQQG